MNNQQTNCEARQLITDKELLHLMNEYHNRHPTFSINLQERTCKRIIFACIYHYRHIQIELKCECIYDDELHQFDSNWSTDNLEYKKILEDLFSCLNYSSNKRSLGGQIESIIQEITKYFTQLNTIKTESKYLTTLPIELIQYSSSPQSRRRQKLFDRSLLSSQSLKPFQV